MKSFVSLYRLLLRLFPSGFAAEYAELMAQQLEEELAEAGEPAPLVIARAFAELPANIINEHLIVMGSTRSSQSGTVRERPYPVFIDCLIVIFLAAASIVGTMNAVDFGDLAFDLIMVTGLLIGYATYRSTRNRFLTVVLTLFVIGVVSSLSNSSVLAWHSDAGFGNKWLRFLLVATAPMALAYFQVIIWRNRRSPFIATSWLAPYEPKKYASPSYAVFIRIFIACVLTGLILTLVTRMLPYNIHFVSSNFVTFLEYLGSAFLTTIPTGLALLYAYRRRGITSGLLWTLAGCICLAFLVFYLNDTYATEHFPDGGSVSYEFGVFEMLMGRIIPLNTTSVALQLIAVAILDLLYPAAILLALGLATRFPGRELRWVNKKFATQG